MLADLDGMGRPEGPQRRVQRLHGFRHPILSRDLPARPIFLGRRSSYTHSGLHDAAVQVVSAYYAFSSGKVILLDLALGFTMPGKLLSPSLEEHTDRH